ncbi:FAD-dependent oxidoreductase [Curtanaerobium respiraculi]|uniref:FAD-dependent oxidoreductase n=1 Tax=Curtanaerobium respiraculi TaxID=2949669 RepID=UPI0024B353FF|nr:FAD-dependent oxidoreductase [Curtanaerobium respiraculi]
MESKENLYDAAIIGGGPAGLTAALYLARARYRVLVVEKDRFGGQITITNEVVNYPGVLSASGEELTNTMRRQAENFGAEFKVAEVTGLDTDSDVKVVHTDKGDVEALAVLLSSGANPRHVGFDGEEEFQGHGVAYCATCDGEFFTGKEVLVVGGGYAAAEESVFLTRYAKHVTILVRKDDFSCAASAAEQAKSHPKISVRYNTRVKSVSGDAALRSAVFENTKTGETAEWRPEDGGSFGLFVLAGYIPATELVKGIAKTDEQGYVLTDEHHMTSVEGLFAAGDVCQKPLRQVATAVGDAAATATEMERYLQDAQKRVGYVPQQPQRKTEDQPRGSASINEGQADPAQASRLFPPDMVAQLKGMFSRMANPVVLRLSLDGTEQAEELRAYATELSSLTDKVDMDEVAGATGDDLPKVEIMRADGTWTGLAFHGVPAGHEFTPFVLGLYNAAGPGQPMSGGDRDRVEGISDKIDMKILVSPTCTMCPDLVVAAQRIANLNDNVTAQVYDAARFPTLRDQYNVMSVPCLIVNDGEKVEFGRKNLSKLLDFLSA